MKHLRLQSLFLLLILQQLAWAGPRTFKQAQAIAERQAAQMGVTISEQARARSFGSSPSVSADAQTSVGTAAYYVFPYGEDKGYAIVSGDDQMPELVAYSDKGTFDEAHMADGCRSFLQAYKAVADAVAKGDEKALRLMAQKRGLLASADYKQPVVEPLLGDIEWDQAEPYNLMCPYNEAYEMRTFAGCVATAMAEIMRYWKYPSELKADIPAYTSHLENGNEGDVYEIPQINKGETYDWDNMLPQYISGKYTDEQATAVAKLMYHCGAAAKMQYSIGGSGASSSSEIFTKCFGYDPDLVCDVYRSEFSLGEWCRLIDGELVAKRPIFYIGATSTSGHAFVCDGADGNGLYHIDWGWSGTYNGYYDISLLDPERGESGWGKEGYTQVTRMFIGIQPDNGVKDAPVVETKAFNIHPEGRELSVTKGERTSASEPFELDYFSYFINLRPQKVKGLINVGIKDEKGDYVPLLKDKHMADLEARGQGIKYYPCDSLKVHIEYAFPVGTTQLHEIYSVDDGNTWQPCSYYEEAYPFEVVATETSLSVAPEKDDFKATVQAETGLVANTKCLFSYTMHNENAYDYFGDVQVYVSHTADEVSTDLAVQDYVSIEAGGSTTHYFTLRPEDEGDLYIWLYDAKHDKMMVEAQKFTFKKAPDLKFLSVTANWKKNTYERENAYLWGERAEMPVIDGDEAVLKYSIRNDGGSFKDNMILHVCLQTKDSGFDDAVSFKKEYELKGDGGITELEYRFNVSDLKGARSFSCRLYSDRDVNIDDSLIPGYPVHLIDSDIMYTSYATSTLYGYFADTSTGITSTPAVIGGLQVSADKGSLTITSAASQPVAIYSLAGQCVRRLHVQAGAATTVLLPSGIYVIGRQKVMVR